jgi:hypothetical protein
MDDPMPRRSRPISATLIAIGNILVGLPCLCCSGGLSLVYGMNLVEPPQAKLANAQGQEDDKNQGNNGAAASPEPENIFDKLKQDDDELEAFLQKELPQRSAVNLAIGIVQTVGSLTLLVSGILLLMGRPMGRTLCFAAAGLLLISGAADVAYSVSFEYPATVKFDQVKAQELKAKNLPPEESQKSDSLLFMIGIVALFSIGYPLLAAGVMITGPVREYYRPNPAQDDELNRYHGDEDYRRPRYDDDFDANR